MLTDAEIKAIWHACDNLGPHEVARNYGRMVRFLLLTAQRRDEAASLRHGHILDGVWRQAENKASRPHQSSVATAGVVAGRARRCAGARVRRPRRQDQRVLDAEASLDQASGVTGWRLHDLRRTAATNMQDLGIRNHIVQAVLNHAVPGVGGVYLRAELEKQKAEALAIWATALTRSSGGGHAIPTAQK